jgi:hypothetical protein
MPRDKQSSDREYEGNTELDRDQREADREYDGGGDDLDSRAEEARELDRNPMKREQYKEDVEAELDDLGDMEGPDA